MKRFLGHFLASVAVLGTVSALAPACVHNDSTVYIHGILAPPAPSATGVCLYTADPSGAKLGSGVLDLAFQSTYEAWAIVGNQMLATGKAESVRAETSRILLQGATVRVTDSAGNEISSFTRLGSGVIEPARGNSPSYGAFETVLIDPKSAAFAASGLQAGGVRRLVSYFKVFGQTLGGTNIESAEYQFPIDVCFRCLVQFPPDSVDRALLAQTGRLNCAATAAAAAAGAARPCTIGQDVPFSCALCRDVAQCDPTYSGTADDPGGGSVAPTPILDAGGGG